MDEEPRTSGERRDVVIALRLSESFPADATRRSRYQSRSEAAEHIRDAILDRLRAKDLDDEADGAPATAVKALVASVTMRAIECVRGTEGVGRRRSD
jgi:hypothetical protein